MTFGGPLLVLLEQQAEHVLNLAATVTQKAGVPGSEVYFNKQAIFDGGHGNNTKYAGTSGVNVFGSPRFINF